MPIAAGTPAPKISLRTKTPEGLETVSLESHVGKDVVVLLFFPAVNTSVCTQEMCDVSGGVHNLADAVVYGISADLPFAQEMWAKAHKITTPLLSDHKLEAAKAFDAVWPDMGGLGAVTARASFVIDRNGLVTYSEQTASLGDMPDFTKIQLAVSEATSV
jgi:peroxiredoxin